MHSIKNNMYLNPKITNLNWYERNLDRWNLISKRKLVCGCVGRLRSQRRERQRVAGVVDLWSCGVWVGHGGRFLLIH